MSDITSLLGRKAMTCTQLTQQLPRRLLCCDGEDDALMDPDRQQHRPFSACHAALRSRTYLAHAKMLDYTANKNWVTYCQFFLYPSRQKSGMQIPDAQLRYKVRTKNIIWIIILKFGMRNIYI